MTRMKWTIRLGILAGLATLSLSAAIGAPPAARASDTIRMSGIHANEAFCQTMIRQMELLGKFDPFDAAKREKFFADHKKLNADLVKTAPASLAGDIVLQTRNANAMMDAQLKRDSARVKAAAAVLRSPANVAASKRLAAYCGATMSP